MTDNVVFSLAIVGVLVVLLGILRLRHVSLQTLVFGVIGAIVGLLLGALASVPLSNLPEPLGATLPVIASILFVITAMALVLSRRQAFMKMLPFLAVEGEEATTESAPTTEPASSLAAGRILVDTSVIIDGRIADIAEAGFVPGVLVVPRFVLAELQNIADSDDAMRRGRGRRGLEVLNRLREMPGVTIEITEEDVSGIREVDAKLVALAQRFSCNVLTTDYNLNRVAQIQGVRVLNVNELSNAIRPVVLPGEELIVRVVQPGKERNQGVGYLADGTMIVVENGDKLMGQEVATEVTRVFQTVAGKMIFATPRKPVGGHTSAPASAPHHSPATPAPQPQAGPAVDVVKPASGSPVAPMSQPTASAEVVRPNGNAAGPRPGKGRGRRHGAQTQAAHPDNSSGPSAAPIVSTEPKPSSQPRHHGNNGSGTGNTNGKRTSSAAIEQRLVQTNRDATPPER